MAEKAGWSSLDELDPRGSHILLRTDINSTVEKGKVEDTLRFERYSKTIKRLQEEGAKVVILAHQGRPYRDDFTKLEEHGKILSNYLENISYLDDIFSKYARKKISKLENGEALLLENVRFLSEELKNVSAKKHSKSIFVTSLSPCFDAYVNDAFSAAHRSHASLMGFTETLDSYAGDVMKEEYRNLTRIFDEVKHSGVLILGGSKPGDEIDVINAIGDRFERILLSGVLGELALISRGYELGKEEWLEERHYLDYIEKVDGIMKRYPEKIMIPEDLAFEINGDREEHDVGTFRGLSWDIGSKTIDKYKRVIDEAAVIFMKGPSGFFEKENFRNGTLKIVNAIKKSNAYKVIGGGHTSSLTRKFDFRIEDFDHVSIAGGALIRLLTGEELPAIRALRK